MKWTKNSGMTELRLLMHISPQSSFLMDKAILSLVLFLLYLWLLISASFWLHSESQAWQSSKRCYSALISGIRMYECLT